MPIVGLTRLSPPRLRKAGEFPILPNGYDFPAPTRANKSQANRLRMAGLCIFILAASCCVGCKSAPTFHPLASAGQVAQAMNPARLWTASPAKQAEVAEDEIRQKLRSENWEDRLKAIGELDRQQGDFSDTLSTDVQELVNDSNPAVKNAAQRWVEKNGLSEAGAAAGGPVAAGYAEKIASVTKIGEQGSDKARQALTTSSKTSSDLIQNATNRAWENLGKKSGLSGVLNDPNWKERAEIAKLLVNEKTAAGLDRGMQLLQDPSVEVQMQTVRSASAWPLQLSGPLWLSALDSKSPAVRQEAAMLLARKWPPAGEVFRPGDGDILAVLADASSPNHGALQSQITALRSRWDSDFGARLGSLAQKGAEYVQTQFSDEQVAAAQQLLETFQNSQAPLFLKQQAAEKLKLFGDQLPDLLHTVAQRTGVPLSESVYRDLLAQTSPVFGALQQLADGTPAAKRVAVSNLAKQVANRYLSDAELARLSGIVQGQQDPQIWSNVLGLIGSDKREAALGIASAATLAPSEAVRNQAAQILSASGDPRYAAVLEAIQK